MGVMGPMTAPHQELPVKRGLRETGEPAKGVFTALQQALTVVPVKLGRQPSILASTEPPPRRPTSSDIVRVRPNLTSLLVAVIVTGADAG